MNTFTTQFNYVNTSRACLNTKWSGCAICLSRESQPTPIFQEYRRSQITNRWIKAFYTSIAINFMFLIEPALLTLPMDLLPWKPSPSRRFFNPILPAVNLRGPDRHLHISASHSHLPEAWSELWSQQLRALIAADTSSVSSCTGNAPSLGGGGTGESGWGIW